MTAQTFTANVVAALVAKRTGARCTGKAIRSWARDNMARFQDDAYTAHAYTAQERDRIVAALVARRAARPMAGDAARAKAAATGRTAPKGRATAPKAPKAPKATPKAPADPQDAPSA